MKCCIGNLQDKSSQIYHFLKLKLWNVIREMEKNKIDLTRRTADAFTCL